MTFKIPTTADVQAAQARISRYVPVTPLLHSPLFFRQYGIDLYVKADSCTATGAFKLRGAVNALCCLTGEQRRKGVVSFSTGNHAQAVAYGASLLNISATIIMPTTVPEVKIANTRALGAAVILYDPQRERREELARCYVEEQGLTLIHPYDDADVIAGQGVAGLECGAQLEQRGVAPDQCYLAISGGGYLAGFCLGMDAFFPNTELIGIEPAVSAPWKTSLENKRNQTITPEGLSLCDAIMPPTPQPGVLPWEILQSRIARIETVTDDDALRGMACAMKYFGLVAEPSGACGLGVILKHREALRTKTVVAVVSGRNVDPDILLRAVPLMHQV